MRAAHHHTPYTTIHHQHLRLTLSCALRTTIHHTPPYTTPHHIPTPPYTPSQDHTPPYAIVPFKTVLEKIMMSTALCVTRGMAPNPHLLAVGTRVSQNLAQAPKEVKEAIVSMLRTNGHNAIRRNSRRGFIYMLCKDCDARCSVSTYKNDAWYVRTRDDAIGRQCPKSADASTKKPQKRGVGMTLGSLRQREKSADTPTKKSKKREAGKQSPLDTLADAADAAAAATAVQMLTPAISCISFPGAELLGSDVAAYVRKQFSEEEKKTQRNFFVASCQSFPADLKCRLSFLIMNMTRALNQHATDPHIEQFQMGFCKSDCNILKQRCVMWWCMYSLCGGGGVRMHVVVYVFFMW